MEKPTPPDMSNPIRRFPPFRLPRRPIHAAEGQVEAETEEEGEEVPAEGDAAAEGEEEEEEEVIEDASELGEDEDDMAEVIENVEEEEH